MVLVCLHFAMVQLRHFVDAFFSAFAVCHAERLQKWHRDEFSPILTQSFAKREVRIRSSSVTFVSYRGNRSSSVTLFAVAAVSTEGKCYYDRDLTPFLPLPLRRCWHSLETTQHFQFSGFFVSLRDELREMIHLPDPDNTPPSSRRGEGVKTDVPTRGACADCWHAKESSQFSREAPVCM